MIFIKKGAVRLLNYYRLFYALKVRSDVKSWDTSLSKSQSRSITLFVSLCFLTPFVRVIVKLGLQFLKNFYVETGRPHILMPLDLYAFQYLFQFPFNIFLLNRLFLLEFTLRLGQGQFNLNQSAFSIQLDGHQSQFFSLDF